MSVSAVLDVATRATELALLAGAPLIGTALVVGVLIGLLQAITQLQDSAVGFVPKLVALAAVVLLAGGFILNQMEAFFRDVFTAIGAFGGGA